jgi:hypothetical protein
VPSDHLFVVREKFGPQYRANNQDLPTQPELNFLHEQFAQLFGTGSIRNSVIWGNWNDLFHDEMIKYGGYSSDQMRDLHLDTDIPREQFALTLLMKDALELVNTTIHAIEAIGAWAMGSRFSFNSVKLGDKYPVELLPEEVFDDDDLWRLSLEMGGLYMDYAVTGKNLLMVMENSDFGSLENNIESFNKIQFQSLFDPHFYVVWAPLHPTEQ